MEHGIIRDWNDMERIWHYIFSKEQLQTVAEEVFSDVPNCVVVDLYCVVITRDQSCLLVES